MGLFFIGFIGFIVSLIILIIAAVRRKKKKVPLVLTVAFLIIGFVGMISAMNTPAIDVVKGSYSDVMSGNLNEQIVEIKGDIIGISTPKDGLYELQVKASDGTYTVYTTSDVAGNFPREGDFNVRIYVTPSYTESNQLIITAIAFPK